MQALPFLTATFLAIQNIVRICENAQQNRHVIPHTS